MIFNKKRLFVNNSYRLVKLYICRSLADIVPILGPEKVIGKNNSRVFSDGSPSRRINKDNQSINISWKPQQQVSGIHTLGDHFGGKVQQGAAAFTRIPPIGAENEDEEGDGLEGSASNLEVSRLFF